MVRAAQKGEKPASKKVAKVAKSMKKSDVEDYATTKHKGLPENKKRLKELIKKIIEDLKQEDLEEITTTDDIDGYQTPFAFKKKKKKLKNNIK